MKHQVFLLFLLLFAVLGVQAQELTVKSFGVAPGDLDARSSTTRRVDRNGTPCALVKVQLPLQGAVFDGVVGDVQFRAGTYWVYLPNGAYLMNISHPQYHRLDLNLRTLWNGAEQFYGVEQLTTYNLIINVPQTGQVQLDDGMRYLALTVIPANSIVEIDGHDCPLESDGTAMIKLTQGSHSYRVKASGYAEEKSTLTIGNETLEKTIRLQSVLASVVVSCATPGAQIYVNGKPKGNSPWSGTLAGGNHDFEARLAGYRNGTVSVTLAERENRRVEIPALQPIAGNLDVAYRPMSTEVWIDGKKIGSSPNVFHGLTVGTHRVELRKDGYQSETKQVTIAQGQTAQLSGQLQQLQQPQQLQASTPVPPSVTPETEKVLTFTVSGIKFKMIRVEGGTFTMGATKEQGSDAEDNEQPAHSVTLSTYYIGETEVTQALWQAVMGSNPSNYKGDNRCPVESVGWEDCQTFIRRLNELTGRTFRLPTEAEWEYAARGGNKSHNYKYSGGNKVGSVAWYRENFGYKTHPVKTKQPNELGIYNMSGNVSEWCNDRYGSYSSAAQTNPNGPTTGSGHVFRGGGLFNHASDCRVSNRNGWGGNMSSLGLRLAL